MLKDNELEKIAGGMSQKELIDYINNSWKIIPEEIRNKIIEKYISSGKPATYKLIKYYIERNHMDYLNPLLDMFK